MGARGERGTPIAVLCLSGFGLGLAPGLPGTVASLATAGGLWFVPASPTAFLGLALACLVFGSWATLHFGGTVSGGDGHGDPGWVVSDEIAGQAVACLGALPAAADWRLVAVSFVLFRALDILKPGPIRALERRPGGTGILLDDLAAGAIAAGLTVLVHVLGVLPA